MCPVPSMVGVVPAFSSSRQEDGGLKVGLGYLVRHKLCQNGCGGTHLYVQNSRRERQSDLREVEASVVQIAGSSETLFQRDKTKAIR